MQSKNRLEHIIHCLVEFRKWWLWPLVIGLALSIGYAYFLKGETWTSRQTMIIRDDLLGQNFKPGSFISEEAMKSAQETVLETARRPEVIRKTLETLGPETKSLFGLGGTPASWPSSQTIEDFRGAVTFEAANGGELGKSEVIVLAAKGPNPERSVEFLSLLLENVDSKLSEIRADRFESMESEMQATLDSAKETRELLASDIMKMESELGTDLTLVRSLMERAGGSPSAFETNINEIQAQRREAERKLSEQKSYKRWLIDAIRNPSAELHTSAELLNSQPALAELVTGLAKAKQELSEAEGRFTARHTKVASGREKVASIQRQIREMMRTVIGGYDKQMEAFEDQIAMLDETLEENAARLRHISGKRVPYAASISQLEKQTDDIGEASARLARMQSRKDASDSIKLLTRVGEPWIGTRADGLGKRAMSLVGGLAGLFIGLGLVMIVAPPFNEPVREGTTGLQSQSAFNDTPVPAANETQTVVSETQLPERQIEEAGLHRLGDYVPRREAKTIEIEPGTVPSEAPVPTAPSQASTDNSIEAAVASAMAGSGTIASAMAAARSEQSQPTEITNEEVIMVDSSSVPALEEPELAPLPLEPVVEPSAPAALQATTQDIEQQFSPPSETQVPQPEAVVAVTEPTIPTPQPRPASKTLAAIFANMPQPRTDVPSSVAERPASPSVIALPDETVNPNPVAIADQIEELANQMEDNTEVQESVQPTMRASAPTIQLDGDDQEAAADAIPLQRRTAVRPVDLAKADETPPTSQASIDSVFSQLKPPSQEVQGRIASPSDSQLLNEEGEDLEG